MPKLEIGVASQKRRMRYGITEAQFAEIAREQYYLCALCGNNVPTDIDHDDKTRLVRGLLCRRCNLGLGMFRDDPGLLQKAISYLERPRSNALRSIEQDRKNNRRYVRGDSHFNAKINSDAVAAIRAEYAKGEKSYSQLGVEYGLSGGTIGKIVRGVRWRAIGQTEHQTNQGLGK